mmetsp:Transcript_26713/g.58481  ORF Transcript_26713/g.58481 Transcript_26713/m.58481 type:complete len:529 (-) Transcript_26713:46-1632(-)
MMAHNNENGHDNDEHDTDDGWETAPTRQRKNKSTEVASKSNTDDKAASRSRRGRGGRGGGGGSGRGSSGGGRTSNNRNNSSKPHLGHGGGNRGFNGWAKPKPPTPTQNASWPVPPPPQQQQQQQTKDTSKQSEELTYLNAVPKLEQHQPSIPSELLQLDLASADAAGANNASAAAADSIEVSEYVGEAVRETIAENKDDEVAGALAGTAAMTLLSSVDAFGLDTGNNSAAAETANPNNKDDRDESQDEADKEPSAATDFKAMCKKPLSDLMADYGEEDKDFDKMVTPAVPMATTADERNDKHRTGSGVLVPHGKAPIHIELVSYGHHYGVPSEATAKGGYSRSRPLPPFDVRDIERAPHHVAKLSGLSYHVKRELLNSKEIEDDGTADVGADGSTTDKAVKFESDKRSPVRRRADDVANEASTALIEAIADGYGHASPLDMTVHIGSEYGRHRSVVIVEAAAITLRNMLRRNEGGRFGSTPISVGTRHRDIDRAHRDEEAFGLDLKREAQAAKKKKEREEREMEGSRW